MPERSIDTTDPILRAWSGSDYSVCPECEHERRAPRFSLSMFIAKRLGLKTPRPWCTYLESSTESEVGMPGECSCRNIFHSS